MSRFGTVLTTKSLIKSHLTEARIRLDRKDAAAAAPHLLHAIEAQQTVINCIASMLFYALKKKAVRA